ncbi:MAG: hypothetical protein QOH86_1307, partial [Sphingomonadales bacterium]|nr:hypothetical protein [Sphingomonadales bacterium]
MGIQPHISCPFPRDRTTIQNPSIPRMHLKDLKLKSPAELVAMAE